MHIYFLQASLIIFTKGVNNSDQHCINLHNHLWNVFHLFIKTFIWQNPIWIHLISKQGVCCILNLHSHPDSPVPTNLIHAGGSVLTPVLDTLIYVDQAGQPSPSRCTNTSVTGDVVKNTMSSIGTWLSKLKSTIIPEQALI